MNAADIETLLHKLHCDKIRQGYTGWVHSACPLSRWRHASGADANPSFSVSIEPDGVSHYKCFACNSVGELPQLIQTLARLTGQDMAELFFWVSVRNVPSAADIDARLQRSPDYWQKGGQKVAGLRVSSAQADRIPTQVVLETLPETTLDSFMPLPPDALAHLTGPRNLTAEAIQYWQLMWHPKLQRIAIPIRDFDKALVGVSGRAFYDYQTPKFLHSSGFHRAYYVYGENALTGRAVKSKRGVLVEGFFDVIYLWQLGYTAVGIMGSKLARFQVEKIVQFFDEMVILPDGDKPGYEAAKAAQEVLSSRLQGSVRIADMPEGSDPDNLDAQQLATLIGPPDQPRS